MPCSQSRSLKTSSGPTPPWNGRTLRTRESKALAQGDSLAVAGPGLEIHSSDAWIRINGKINCARTLCHASDLSMSNVFLFQN